VEVRNQSDFEANAVTVRASIPAWVDLDDHEGTSGRVLENKVDDNIEWLLESVKAKGSQRLKLNLIPRKGKAFELKVELAVQPRKVKRQITIREPQLTTKLVGPDSLVFEEEGVFKITLANPGTAVTENVAVQVVAAGRKVASFTVDSIAPGSERVAELDLTASSVGAVPLEVVTTAEPGLKDQARHQFTVRRGLPHVSVRGSSFLFAGNAANYEVNVKNDGDAALKYVDVSFTLPMGATYVSGLKSPRVKDRAVHWTVDEIAAGASLKFPLVIQLKQRGKHEFTVQAAAGDDQVVRSTIATLAETSADLKLTVTEPQGPQPIGKDAEYKIRIANVGSAAAKDVSIIAVLPPELKATAVTGDAAVKANQIFFRQIKSIEPDKDVVHTVKVRATISGNHTFRVVVQALNPRLRFSSEDTTRYFDRNKYPTSTAAAKPLLKKKPAKRVAGKLPRILPR
ncbi:MAG: CARDB domain-containing protein, partial [Planctomycetaceae bacterium]